MIYYSKKVWFEVFLDKFPIPHHYIALLIGAIIYSSGLTISFITDNLGRFLYDYPWLVYTIYIIIGIWATPHFLNEHRKAFHHIRHLIQVTDEEFKEFTRKIDERLASRYSIPFSFIFFPILLWVSLNRLWWNDYNQVFIYDIYSWVIFTFILIANGIGIWVGCVAFNLNYKDLCEKMPLDVSELIFERFRSLNKNFGSLCIWITLLYLVFSTLSNLPIIMLTKTSGAMLNFLIALSMTSIVLIVPQFMFHQLITIIKNREKENIKKLYNEYKMANALNHNGVYERIHNLLSLIHLYIYRNEIDGLHEWLIDLRSLSIVIISFFVSTAIKIIIGDILKPILSILY